MCLSTYILEMVSSATSCAFPSNLTIITQPKSRYKALRDTVFIGTIQSRAKPMCRLLQTEYILGLKYPSVKLRAFSLFEKFELKCYCWVNNLKRQEGDINQVSMQANAKLYSKNFKKKLTGLRSGRGGILKEVSNLKLKLCPYQKRFNLL